MQKLRITAVSYLNTKPFIYGLFLSELANHLDLSLDIPSACAQKLLRGEADIALTPVAVIPDLPHAYLVSDFCIGATGPVKTVCLFSQTPLPNIRRILLDFHSRTSVALVQILCKHYWNIEPEFVPASEGFEQHIKGDTAAVIIGDRAIGKERQFEYVYDLGAAWTEWTGLPFVFAAWISTKPLDPALLDAFNRALAAGIERVPQLIHILPTIPGFNLREYFRENISYELDEAKWIALNRFLTYLAGHGGYALERLEREKVGEGEREIENKAR